MKKKYKGIGQVSKSLTPKEKKFLEAYTNADAPSFLNATESASVSYDVSTRQSAQSLGGELVNKPKVVKALKQMLEEDKELDTKLFEGLQERLSDASNANRYWQGAAELFCKLKGLMAPDKQIVMNVTPEDRDREYDKILDKVRKAQDANKSQP